MASNAKLAREQRMAEKASVLFLLYEQMGPDRSLTALFKICTTVGLKISESTIKRYSITYDWQRQLLERAVQQRERAEQDILGQVEKMNEDHIRVNRGLMNLAIAGIQHYQDQLERKRGAGQASTLAMGFSDIVKLVKQAQLGERLARGQATSRTEVMVEVISTFVQEFALIFKAVNTIENPDEREREYIRLFDERLSEYYSQLTAPALKKAGGSLQ